MIRLTPWELTLIVLTICAGAWSVYLSPYYLSVGQIASSTRHFIIPGILGACASNRLDGRGEA